MEWAEWRLPGWEGARAYLPDYLPDKPTEDEEMVLFGDLWTMYLVEGDEACWLIDVMWSEQTRSFSVVLVFDSWEDPVCGASRIRTVAELKAQILIFAKTAEQEHRRNLRQT